MKAFKFGGASVKDPASVRNVAAILSKHLKEPSVVVLSAMGKMTNAFEKLVEYSFYKQTKLSHEQFLSIKKFHLDILKSLFPCSKHKAFTRLHALFSEIETMLERKEKDSFDFYYDQLVPYGEMLSTSIVSSYLEESGLIHALIDARKLICTNSTWRDARIHWDETSTKIKSAIDQELGFLDADFPFVLTQGFIGSNHEGNSTTLGREGSDFTSAIFAYVLDANEVIIWKDVPGLLNADPKIFSETVKISRLSYSEAIELAYYGAKIIHPKTIKPLQNKNIPLIIKSFANPELPGSLIKDSDEKHELIPSYIVKCHQTLISITPKDFSFINEENLFDIFGIFSKFRVRINLMQNSAISFSVCIDGNKSGFESLIKALQVNYKVKYNQNLELITIRNYDQSCIDKSVNHRSILLEQRSRATVQVLVTSS